MSRWHLLAVDDEPLNLEIIREYLDDPRMDLDLAANAERAWQWLETAAMPYDLVILDRMMPGMSGIEMLRRMKADARYRSIPVIIQTAASSPDQVREGIEAGAYYYLTKPYEPAALFAIVRAALADVEDQSAVVRRAAEQAATLSLLESAAFRFATLDDAHRLAGLLAALCPVPATAAMGLTELMVNAVEHGNLGISYAEKVRLKREDAWEAEIARRLALPENCAKAARIGMRRTAGEAVFTIRDEGQGFEWRRYLEFDPARAFDPNGRGIAMARMLSFSRLDYCGCGNEVVAAVKL
ncbi:MAG: response regulator receiver protein [Rhodocyclales bacterium GWA2_65_20]|nr:MAG: response regulator receiver protein [Rhodocyclales bacterium GWA2_65_20]